MRIKKNNSIVYGVIAIFVSVLCISQVNAAEYENYFGIEMTNSEYNTLLNLGFTEDEIYYMNEETYLQNKDANANLEAKETKYYKTIYTDLVGNSYSTEITEDEYENQPMIDSRGTVTTGYKQMVSTISQNGNKYRFKVSVAWRNMPTVKSYDIIGVGFEDNKIYIDSSVYFNFYWCNSSGNCTTDASYYDKKSKSTGGSAVYDLPNSPVSLSATLYYDVAKSTSNTITSLRMCGDYSHATSNVSIAQAANHDISISGLELGSGTIGYYDEIPCAISTWNGSW